tara:strand:- start:3256 stop:3708 length:453 start_codon:yes stop_codon:yes gene_type:complete
MKIGEKLKNLKFLIDSDSTISISDLGGKKLVVYFYPKDDTPGCTKEALEFSNLKSEFNRKNVNIIGVSKDSIDKHKKFISKYKLNLKLASDEDLKICKAFKVWVEKSMYGKKYMGIERSTFLFDENLQLIKSWRKVKVNGHAEEVLNYLD